jgi:hypothetical protein
VTWTLLNATEERLAAFDERLDEVLDAFDTLDALRDQRLREAFPDNEALQAIAKDWRGQICKNPMVRRGEVMFGRIDTPLILMPLARAFGKPSKLRPKPALVAFVHPDTYEAMRKAIKG